MPIELPGAIVRRIMRSISAGARPGRETCGILIGGDNRIMRADFTDNVSLTPSIAFEIAPAALIAAHKAQRRPGGLSVLGCFHTHPGGDPSPSPRDAECAAPDGSLWLIATAIQARLWKAVNDGSIYGRFDPVRFDLRVGRRITPNLLEVRHGDDRHIGNIEIEEPPAWISIP